MKIIRRLLKRFWRWLMPAPKMVLVSAEEVPDRLKSQVGYVIGQNGHEWHIVMSCPCGCSAPIYLNLLPDDFPRWELTRHCDQSFSLFPSVWRTTGCRSHFFVRRSRIEWCGSTTRN